MPIYCPEQETMPRRDLEQLQVERLQGTLNRIYRNVAFFRQQCDRAKLDPTTLRSLEALRDLPFTTREDLRRSYPYDMFAVPLRDVVRIHSTSGTTGKPIGVGYTWNDLQHWSELVARLLTAVGISDRDFVQIAFHSLTTGLFGFHAGAERLRASVIPSTLPDLHEQVRIMRDYKTTALLSTPTYALRIAQALADMQVHPEQLDLRCALLGGEPWSEALRQRIQDELRIKAYDNYGLSEIIGPGIAGECEAQNGLHINEDHFLVEVIDPKRGEPVAAGDEGELVFTTLTKEAFPLVRYRTGDLARLLPGPCPCGRTFVRMSRIQGRSDDLVIVGGIKFFPSLIEEILLASEGIAPQAELVLRRREDGDVIELHAQLAPGYAQIDEIKQLQRLKGQLTSRVTHAIGLPVHVTFVEHGALTRAAGKRKLIVTDQRSQQGGT